MINMPPMMLLILVLLLLMMIYFSVQHVVLVNMVKTV